MKIFKKNLLLLIILLIVGSFYFYQVKIASKKKKNEEKKLFVFEKEKIKGILIKNDDKEIEIVNENGLWKIKGKNYECDKNEIESLINKILSLEIERNIGTVDDLSIYGLSSSEKQIEIQKDGEKFILYIGDETPSSSYLYTTKDKKEVLLVYKWDLDSILGKNIFDLRDKRIIPVDITKEDIEEIEVNKKNKTILLKRSGERWYIESPLKDIANREKIERVVGNIIDGEVKEFEELKTEKECGLERPESTIKLKTKDSNYFIYLGKKKENLYYAKNSLKPYIFLADDKIVDDIPDEINELREKKLFDIDVSEVEEFSIIKKDKELKFKKEKDSYFLEGEKTKKISKDKVEEFLHDLKYLEIKDFIEYSEKNLKDFQLSPPLIKIIVYTEGTKTEVHFGKKTENYIYCYSPERKSIFTIPSSDYSRIDKDEGFFVEEKKRKNE
ncbi:MAG TPA: DUF4340 domain-containing protein [bacterium]|nr:DUF4340 domain-containing protein [bacterium]HOM26030.1 DUF4340 domain-containing protein [bacterium]